MKQMWVEIKGMLGKQAGEANAAKIATLRTQNGKMVTTSAGKRELSSRS